MRFEVEIYDSGKWTEAYIKYNVVSRWRSAAGKSGVWAGISLLAFQPGYH